MRRDRTPHRLWLLLLPAILASLAVVNLHAQPPQPTPPQPPQPSQPPGPPPVVQEGPPPALGSPLPPPSSPPVIRIDPKTPLKDLLPVPPKSKRRNGPVLSNDLADVPEVRLEAIHDTAPNAARRHIATQIAKINHLNAKKSDGFMEALLNERVDLAGLPFAMGDACRTKGDRSRQFALAVATVRQALQNQPRAFITPSSVGVPTAAPAANAAPVSVGSSAGSSGLSFVAAGPQVIPGSGGPPPATTGPLSSVPPPPTVQPPAPVAQPDPVAPEVFWDQYRNLCTQEDRARPPAARKHKETVTLARIAALTQILMPMTEMQPGLVRYLAGVSHVEATHALARLALFSSEEETRKAALEALKVRRERDYTKILLAGLRYPWPAVAKRAAEAIVQLERKDLLPDLIAMLETPDPRGPVMKEGKDKRGPVVRELVRVNHHRSCLLCHAPGNTGKVSGDAVTAEVPVPGQPLNPPSSGYGTSQTDILVRVDVTYLRQDFSALQAVADANPWPEMQRFDYLVRTRELTESEAAAYRDKLKPREEGEFSPYQRAALTALRDLTGRDTEPTPEAWRRLLKLPAGERNTH